MRRILATTLETVGVLAAVAAVGFLAGLWWGVLTGGLVAVALAQFLEVR